MSGVWIAASVPGWSIYKNPGMGKSTPSDIFVEQSGTPLLKAGCKANPKEGIEEVLSADVAPNGRLGEVRITDGRALDSTPVLIEGAAPVEALVKGALQISLPENLFARSLPKGEDALPKQQCKEHLS